MVLSFPSIHCTHLPQFNFNLPPIPTGLSLDSCCGPAPTKSNHNHHITRYPHLSWIAATFLAPPTMLTGFDPAILDTLLTAQEILLQTTQKAREISISLDQCGRKIHLMKQRVAALEYAMDPLLSQSKKSRCLINCIKNAVKSAGKVLEVATSARELEGLIVQKDPMENLEEYVERVLEFEGFLNFVGKNLPLALGQLEEAVKVSNSSSFIDECIMQRVNNCIESLERSAKDDCGDSRSILEVVAEKLEASFKLGLGNLPVSNKRAPQTVETLEILKPQETLKRLMTLETLEEKKKNFFVSVDKNIKEIALFLKRNGRAQQCLKIYWDVRVRVVKEGLKALKCCYLNCDYENVDVMKWDDVEGHVLNWLRLLGVVGQDLLGPERQLCCEIFEGFGDEVWTECFGNLALVSGMDEVLKFGESIAVNIRETQAMFKLLDMFEGLENLKGEVFGGNGCLEMRLRFRELQKQLAYSCRRVLSDFSKVVEEDSGLPADGSLLKITSYVVNYLKFLVGEYRPVMVRVLEMEGVEDPELGLLQTVEDAFRALERNLEGRSKGYAEPALTHLFLMNNYWYIFKRSRDSELAFLGEAWLKERRRWVNQQVLAYEKQEWGPVLVNLNREGLDGSTGSRGVAKELFKERLRVFNSVLDQICETHRHWVISDVELREGTLVKVTQVLVPAYRSFIETFGHLLDNSSNGNRYLRYNPEQLEDLLTDLFIKKSSKMETTLQI